MSTHLRVYGDPAPQGSKRHVGNGVMVESSKRVKPWRQAVTTAAADAAGAYTGPVRVDCTFLIRRPKGHWGTGRNTATLKPSAPLYVTSRAAGDLDKLLRSTLDGLADGGLLARDDLVVIVTASKCYCNPGSAPGALITIRPAEETQP